MKSVLAPCRISNRRVALFTVTAVSVLGGCQQFPAAWKNPFASAPPAYKAAYGPTPRQRMQSIHELAARAASMSGEDKLRTVQQLSEVLEREPDPLIRGQSVSSLAHFDIPEAEACLRQAIHDPSPDVRAAACRACAVRPASDAMMSLLHDRMTNDEHHEVRCAAVAALASLRAPEALNMAAEALRDQDPAIQVMAMNALRKSTGQELGRDVNVWLAYLQNRPRQQGPNPQQDPEIQLATAIGE